MSLRTQGKEIGERTSNKEAEKAFISAFLAGNVTYTMSNAGQRMLYANAMGEGCKEAATPAASWVIKMEQPETVYSFQMTAVPDTFVNDDGELNPVLQSFRVNGAPVTKI